MSSHLSWYLIHCEAHHDAQVARLVGLRGLETYAPRMERRRKRDGDKPLFPGYVFVRLDLGAGVWNEARYLPGVRTLVNIGGAPCVVDDGLVEAIRLRVDGGGFKAPALQPGDRVKVTTGPFTDLEAIFSETLSGAERVAVLIDMMERQVRIELPLDGVQSAERAMVA